MTALNPEIKVENTLNQEKVDTTLTQQNVDTTSSQKPIENKEVENAEGDPNWRAFREARKKDRADREAAERRAVEKEAEVAALKAAMEAAFAKGNPVPQQQPNYFQGDYQHEDTEDERIDKKVQAAIAKKEAEYERMRVELEQREYPQRLKQSYPDFNQTISQENLDYLDYHFPEVSRPLQRLQEGFDKWEDIYRAVKKFVPNNTTVKKDAARADANSNKPKSISSTGITQTESRESQQSVEARRAERFRQMQRVINQVS